MNDISAFKTTGGRHRYLEAYDAMMSLWSTPYESRSVETSFGVTHLHVAGPNSLPPLLMLHGFGLSSTQWFSNVGAMSQSFRVYMPDVVDQPGLSIATRTLESGNYASWLIELMDGLKIERAPIVGHSYGGWIALNVAMAAPQRVDKLVLLSPAASFFPFASSFFVHAGAAYLLPGRPTTEWFLQWMTTMPMRGHALVDQVVLGFKYFRMRHGVPSLFSNHELSRVKAPALLLMGEHDRHYSILRVEQRARQTVPGIQVEVIAGGGHLFPLDRAEETNARILSFLRETRPNP